MPSDIFREHSLACYVSDPVALKVRHDIGIDIIAWECDYPHSDSIWPDAPETVMREMDGAGVHRRRDPQDHVGEHAAASSTSTRSRTSPKEQATVGALRAQSPDVDTTIRSRHEWAERYATAHAGT